MTTERGERNGRYLPMRKGQLWGGASSRRLLKQLVSETEWLRHGQKCCQQEQLRQTNQQQKKRTIPGEPERTRHPKFDERRRAVGMPSALRDKNEAWRHIYTGWRAICSYYYLLLVQKAALRVQCPILIWVYYELSCKVEVMINIQTNAIPGGSQTAQNALCAWRWGCTVVELDLVPGILKAFASSTYFYISSLPCTLYYRIYFSDSMP